MPFCAARWMVSRRLHATQTGGWGFWRGLGTTLRGGMVTKGPAWPVNGRLGQAPQRHPQPFLPHGPLVVAVDHEPAQLGLRARLAGAELHPAVGDEVQRGDPLGYPGRVVEGRRRLDDPVAELDPLGALATPRPGTPRAPTSGCTPPRSGARPPRRSRSRGCRRARTARGRPAGSGTRSPPPRAAGAGARRRCRTSRPGCPSPLGLVGGRPLDESRDDGAELGRVPPVPFVNARPWVPPLGHADHAAGHVEHPPGDPG